MSLRRPALGLAAFALSGLLLAGCAGGSSAPETEAPEGDAPAVTADEELHALLPADAQEDGVVVGTEAFYPPYEYLDADGSTVIGLDIDLLDAVTARLGISYTLENVAFDTLLPSLDGARYDIVVAGMTDTVERQANYDFVDYFNADQAIIVASGNPEGISTIADLCGQTVAVLVDSTQQEILSEADCDEPIDILTQPTDNDALLQVQSGRAVATLTQEATGRYNASQIGGGSAFEVANTESIDPRPLGYVFQKDSELVEAFQAALQSLVDDGTYAEILAGYELDAAALETITVNGAEQ
ncbi:ABC transporter substrate-binding protein [Microbacterium marinilacus]|uniref:ABC transporter substrate-binding protein n=1 Tax=Microbacterium marinilacus TaxID=415209 RepID=A0ABP7BA10_9MICO|nr:ABC transporter substrate-binding protein [Microbacterium marinilacus]MBY0687321.1 ABC transporter substrate-binding protein [Microbacterium marinilacus]